MAMKKMWKLEEFPAHIGNVNCLALGHKSVRVMVTGGEDRKVNIWAIGKPNSILSLAGHTTPVECVRFSLGEDTVIAGSLSGALKLWDLESVKIIKTLTGHKSSVKSVDFHPFGNFVASGSLDTNIKLWDLRKKDCIFTYKGHSNSISCLRFSPDGRWIISGGEDGLVKLWDLSAGKMLTEFKNHTGPITSVEFHPNDFLLATGSADRTVKFWDLESMQMVSSTDGDSLPIRALTFHPDRNCLYSGAENQLRVYGWEPYQCFDTLSTGWNRVSDIAIAQNQLVGASFSQNNVSMFIVDIERIQPISGPPAVPDVPHARPPTTTRGRRSFVGVDSPETTVAHRLHNKPKEVKDVGPVDEPVDETKPFDVVGDPREVFHARKRLEHSPPISVKPFPAPPEDVGPVASVPPRSGLNTQQPEPNYSTSSEVQSAIVSTGVTAAATRPQTSVVKKDSRTKKVVHKTVKADSGADDSVRSQRNSTAGDGAVTRPDKDQSGANTKSALRDDFSIDIRVAPRRARNEDMSHFNDDFQALSVNESGWKDSPSAARINAEEFLQKPSTGHHNSKQMTDDEAVMLVHGGHEVLKSVLVSRYRNLQVVKAMWSAGNVKTAIESALSMNDQAVVHDVVNLMLNKTALWNLDLCVLLIPALAGLTASKYPNYIRTGFDALKHILRQYAPIIKSNITAPPSIGVDISREERYSKCMSCYKLLMNVQTDMEHKSGLSVEAAQHYRELRLLLSQLE